VQPRRRARPRRTAAPALARELARGDLRLPARYEPFGLSVLEAALSGCALVLGDIASLREVWGGAACYVRPGDSRAAPRAACA
jgi:glycogen(starch) synthase